MNLQNIKVYHDGNHYLTTLTAAPMPKKQKSGFSGPMWESFKTFYDTIKDAVLTVNEKLKYIRDCFKEDAGDKLWKIPQREKLVDMYCTCEYSDKYEKFKEFYKETKEFDMPAEEILEYIRDRFVETAVDILRDIPSDSTLEVMYANYVQKGSNHFQVRFVEFYEESLRKKITKKKRLSYIRQRFIDTADDITIDVPSEELVFKMFKEHVLKLHKRRRRYLRKAYLYDWSYFVTFTYADQKMSEDEFEHKIASTLSDFSSHRGWKYMMAWERGEKGNRLHLHAFVYVPDGKMVGELYTRVQSSFKRGTKREIVTDNTYFQERFGNSDWKPLGEMRNHKSLINYLAKYMCKGDGRIIYSRGIPETVDMVVDMDESDSIFTSIFEKGNALVAILSQKLFVHENKWAEAFEEYFDIEDSALLEAIPI